VHSQGLGNEVAESAVALVLFGGYDASGFVYGFEEGLGVEGLDGREVDDFGRYALGGEGI